MSEITHCDECENLLNGKDYIRRWVCGKFPRLDGVGYVSSTYAHDPPFMLCAGINGGKCPMYQPKRTTEKE
jgi:hypothetical protein